MNNHQGLEALAALASAAPPTESRVPGDANRTAERDTTGRAGKSETPTASSANQTVQSNQGIEQGLNPTQSAQWQQIMSSLASAGANTNQLGSNPLASGPNLSLLAGMQANPNPQHDSSSLLMAMQNMAYYQLMAQSQAASQNQLSALSNLAAQISRTNPQATALALAGQNPLSSFLKGKPFLSFLQTDHGTIVSGRKPRLSPRGGMHYGLSFYVTNLKLHFHFCVL
jgi:hypothetical protein